MMERRINMLHTLEMEGGLVDGDRGMEMHEVVQHEEELKLEK